ncbi:ketoacyl-ACP synthase III [Rhodospirillaceae bacterium KN72]|uniref:Beta-ketoacyl-[acyl-carrier-protein] synthase III n=1 Tax=Pacificispira spongiicola TaxID=2729598 RepID=A0A7Y0E2V3_9PROT|nr:beta-ketoacyl-ACP synthase III [Pacificispira spongiicola]NMM46219.1 ketoacyl-ACP synthase III [Pacificispira spongiicola]
MNMRSVIRGVGAYLPEKVVTNDDLSKTVDTSDEWIRQRTGIARRHIAAPEETTTDLACAAARRAMEHAGVAVEEIDLVILATTTPDNTFPATATRVQARLGVRNGPAFDIQAVCSGFVYALTQADNMIRLGQAKCALVIGAEIYSRILDWEDRGTCVLFGDGAGAVVLRGEASNGAEIPRGILATKLGADGRYYDSLYVDGGPATTGTAGFVRMQGKEVFKYAVERMSSLVADLLAQQGLTTEDLDWLVPHQANVRIINKVGERLNLPSERVVVSVEEHANTSAATIPLAMNHAVERQLFKPGDLIGLTAMGGGFTWGAALLRW